MVTQKPDTSLGFRPVIPGGRDLLAPALAALRFDGALERSLLSPQLHQVLLGMARLRNAVSSFQMEGDRVALDRARKVLETDRPEAPAERGVLQLAKAYGDLARGRLPEFSPAGIREAHSRIFDGVLDGELVGQFKRTDNRITDASGQVVRFAPTPATRVSAEIDSLLAWLREAEDQLLPPPVVAAIFFAEFEAIHPFLDGNGRVGRYLNVALLAYLGLRNAGLVPLDTRFFRTSDHYYEYLATTNTGQDYRLWIRYYVTQLRQAYEVANRRGDLNQVLERFRRPSTRSVLRWVLEGSGAWFHRRDFPNPRRLSGPALWGAFQELVRSGILEARGEARGREYRLRSDFLTKVYRGIS